MSYESNKKWRKNKPKVWNATKNRYYKQFEKEASNKHQRWTINDILLIESKKVADRKIAKLIGRSVKAIQVKRAGIKRNILRGGILKMNNILLNFERGNYA